MSHARLNLSDTLSDLIEVIDVMGRWNLDVVTVFRHPE